MFPIPICMNMFIYIYKKIYKKHVYGSPNIFICCNSFPNTVNFLKIAITISTHCSTLLSDSITLISFKVQWAVSV